jgi:hypothetical protein
MLRMLNEPFDAPRVPTASSLSSGEARHNVGPSILSTNESIPKLREKPAKLEGMKFPMVTLAVVISAL